MADNGNAAADTDGTVAVQHYDFRFNDSDGVTRLDHQHVDAFARRTGAIPSRRRSEEAVGAAYDMTPGPGCRCGYFVGDYDGLDCGRSAA